MDAKKDRFQLLIPEKLLEEVRRLAADERRSISNMLVVLTEEAIRARQKTNREAEPGQWEPALLAA